ncbi:MAG: hypothetical protein QME94_13465, partial [Anaerolineae bacterium]|nr:hypothetical protein [Anaerolineae bacterium]
LAALLQSRRLRRETYAGVRELCRQYEGAIGGLVLAEAHQAVRQLEEAVAVTAAQLRAVERELQALEAEAGRALDELARFPYGNTYLEQQLSDPAHCARAAGQVTIEELLGTPAGEEMAADLGDLSPAEILAATVRGDLPAAALGAGLVEAVGRMVAGRGCGTVEMRVEEVLVAGVGGPFSAEATMEGLRSRALPLWHADEETGGEIEFAVMSREAAMAFRGWLAARTERVHVLPTLQRDRISYLRLRRFGRPALRGACTG